MAIRYLVAAAMLAELASSPALALTPLPWPEPAAECSGLAGALRDGTAIVCSAPSIADPSFAAEHRFRCDDAEACAYTQTMPDERTLWRRFSEAGRAEFAANLDAHAPHSIGAIGARECEVRDRTGAIIPFEHAHAAGHHH
ncbi:MAG: hypothetical protein J0L81_13965 [Caulobacterales bacterium]|jgi:hypothetical protein|nr:hypothetical protein [Caulobacterales bacterium]